MGTHEVKPKSEVKLLGVIFDKQLRWRAHVQRAVKRATKTCLAIGRLRHLRPKQMRQLYQACVIPQMDYASTVWHSPQRCKWQVTTLSRIQRIATIKAISAFRTVATETLDYENFVLPTKLRLQIRAARVVTNLRTLPASHPCRKLVEKEPLSLSPAASFLSPLNATLKQKNPKHPVEVEVIDTCPLPPWQANPLEEIRLAPLHANDTTALTQETREEPDTKVFTDASKSKDQLGAAAVILNQAPRSHRKTQKGVGSGKYYSIAAAELIAINAGMELAAEQQLETNGQEPSAYTIYSDSKAALQALANPHKRKSGQGIVRSVLTTAQALKESLQINFTLQWVPSHCGIHGNEEADKLARAATTRLREHDHQPLAHLQIQAAQERAHKQWAAQWKISDKGHHLRSIDTAQPGPHVRHLYDKLPRSQAGLLAQMRTGHCWLNQHRKRIGLTDSEKCECGEVESISHVLLDCPLLQDNRQRMYEESGLTKNSLSTLLGGKPLSCTQPAQRKEPKWKISASQLQAVLKFARDSQRFINRDEPKE